MTDWPDLFSVLEEHEETEPTADPLVERVITDRQHGHIVLHGAEWNEAARDVAFVDLGTSLHFWGAQGCLIDAPRARALADALTWWADRREGSA